MMEKKFIIINPNAASKTALQKWNTIKALLEKEAINFEFYLTKSMGDAFNIAKDAISAGYNHIIGVGGDGTVNEIVNGIFHQKKIDTKKIKFAFFEAGTGNDWGKSVGISQNYQNIIKSIKNNKNILQDIGVLTIDNKIKKYFANVSGIGLDSYIAKKMNILKNKGKASKIGYFLSIFSSIFSYKPDTLKIVSDEFNKEIKTLSMSIGIGKYNGGGLMQIPHALIDDGLLSVTLIKKIPPHVILKNAAGLFNGKFIKSKHVITFNTKHLEIVAKNNIIVELDGEIYTGKKFVFSLLPRALNVITEKL